MTAAKKNGVDTGEKIWVKPELTKRPIDEFGRELIAQIKTEAMNINMDELKENFAKNKS